MNDVGGRSCGHPVLRLVGVTVTYPPATTVLDDVSFQVLPGELVAVVGPNGAGKSTLFKAISGLVAHDGIVELGGTHCHHQRDRLEAAYIPQRTDLDHDFPITVGQLVLAGRRRFLRLGQRPGQRHRLTCGWPCTSPSMRSWHRSGCGNQTNNSSRYPSQSGLS